VVVTFDIFKTWYTVTVTTELLKKPYTAQQSQSPFSALWRRRSEARFNNDRKKDILKITPNTSRVNGRSLKYSGRLFRTMVSIFYSIHLKNISAIFGGKGTVKVFATTPASNFSFSRTTGSPNCLGRVSRWSLYRVPVCSISHQKGKNAQRAVVMWSWRRRYLTACAFMWPRLRRCVFAMKTFYLGLVSGTGNRHPIPTDRVPAVSYQ